MGIVCLSIVGIILEEMKSGFININPTIIRVMRVLRIARGKQTSLCFNARRYCKVHHATVGLILSFPLFVSITYVEMAKCVIRVFRRLTDQCCVFARCHYDIPMVKKVAIFYLSVRNDEI